MSGAETEAPSSHLVEVAFRGNRKEFFAWEGEAPPPLRAGVVVEVERGEDFGRVHSTGALAEVRCRGCAHGCGTAPPPRRVLRLATPDDERRELGALQPERSLDEGIVRTVWMSPEEIRASAHLHRSPLLLRCMQDHLDGRRYPLELLSTDPSVYRIGQLLAG